MRITEMRRLVHHLFLILRGENAVELLCITDDEVQLQQPLLSFQIFFSLVPAELLLVFKLQLELTLRDITDRFRNEGLRSVAN